MSEITPNDLPPLNELDQFTTHIPELQTDTDVLAGTGGPANFQAQALANRTKYLKRVLDAVSQQLTGINQAVAAAQQTADTAKQGADASMKKSANGADIPNPATFRTNIGLSNAMLVGQFGWGGAAKIVTGNLGDFFGTNAAPSGLYQCDSSQVTGLPEGFGSSLLVWHFPSPGFGVLYAEDVTAKGKISFQLFMNNAWQGWATDWNSANLNPVTVNTDQAITSRKTFLLNNASVGIQPAVQGAASYFAGEDNDGSLRWLLGHDLPGNTRLSLASVIGSNAINLYANGVIEISAPDVSFAQGKGFVKNARAAPGFDNISAILANWRGEQSMGSVLDNSNNQWRAFINVRHRGGNANRENGGGDSADWGFVFVDDNMTANAHNFRIVKMRAGVWGTGVDLYHTGNTTVDANGFLKVASPIVKLFGTGASELNTESDGITTERIDQGVYRISGCLGLNADLAWGGLEGGIVGPRCRNGLERLW
ncbi:hypothetical protein F9U44_18260, partial [Pectobacterium versatile]|nr:hypothetical protein [Pectobacterium versatile]